MRLYLCVRKAGNNKMDVANNIRASCDDICYSRPRIVRKENNFRFWLIVVEQVLQEKKWWGHVTGALRPFLGWVLALAIAAVAAVAVVPVVAGVRTTPCSH